MIEVDETRNGGQFDITVGECIEMRLSENPTTGYRWHLDLLDGFALKCEHDLFETTQQAPGAPGLHRWRLRAIEEGVARVELHRRRSWEAGAVGTFAITVRVKAR